MPPEDATAVAEPIVETPESVQAPPPVETPAPADAPESAPVDDATESDSGAFDVTQLPEYQEAVKAPDPVVSKEAAAPEMPGEPVEQVITRLETQRAQAVNGYMQASEGDWMTYLTNDLGLTRQDANTVWHGKLGPIIRTLLQGNSAYNKTLFHTAVDSELPDDAKQAFYSQVYPNQAKALKGVYTAGEAIERKKWEAKLSKGELLTPEQVKKIGDAAYNRGLGIAEQEGTVPGASAGQQVQSSAPSSGGSYRTVGDLSRAYNQPNSRMTEAQFAREHKRLTGKLPGE